MPRQCQICSTAPEISGPTITPRDVTAPQIPIAVGRVTRSKTWVMIERVPGMNIAPPTPMRARPAMTTFASGASAPIREPAASTAIPSRNTLRRP